MTTPHTDGSDVPPTERSVTTLELADGGLVVYDPERRSAWIETDAPVDVDSRC